MEPREKILAIVAFSATALVVLYLSLVKMVIEPTAEATRKADTLEVEVDELRLKVKREPRYMATLRDSIANSYGDEISVASGNSRDFLVRQFSRLGISGEDLRMVPGTGKAISGGKEVGWSIHLKGSQQRLTELLYQLQADSHLHRIDTIHWSPVPNSADLNLSFRFATLVLDPPPGQASPDIDPDKVPSPKLGTDERKVLAMITDRDIFRPYIKRPPAPQPPQPPANTNTTREPPPDPPKPPPSLQVVGLPSWGSGKSDVEILVKDLKTLKTTSYKVGGSLLDGEILMVDYRPMPLPRKPEIISNSRVLLLIGPEIWAIELGQQVADRYRFPYEKLPEEKKKELEWLIPKPAANPPADSTPSETTAPVGADSFEPEKSSESSQESPDLPVDTKAGNKGAAQGVTSDGEAATLTQPSNAEGAVTGSEPPTKEAGNAP